MKKKIGYRFFLMTAYLVVEVPSIFPVVLVTAVLCRRALPLHVISQVVFKDAGEGHCRQHAHHRSQSQHQTHHHTSKIYSADGIQGHWCERSKRGKGERWGGYRWPGCYDPSLMSLIWLESKLIFSIYFHLMLLSHTTGALPLYSIYCHRQVTVTWNLCIPVLCINTWLQLRVDLIGRWDWGWKCNSSEKKGTFFC